MTPRETETIRIDVKLFPALLDRHSFCGARETPRARPRPYYVVVAVALHQSEVLLSSTNYYHTLYSSSR